MSLWNYLRSFVRQTSSLPQAPANEPQQTQRPCPPPPTMDIPFLSHPRPMPRSTTPCWLTAIQSLARDRKHYIYTVTLPSKPPSTAICHVPARHVRPETQERLANDPDNEILIPRHQDSKASCTFLDLVGEDDTRHLDFFAILIAFKSKEYHGYASVQRHRTLKSIEVVPDPLPRIRTVEFLDPIDVARAKVRTEVWSRDGNYSYTGSSTLVKMEVGNGRRYLTIKAPYARAVYVYLVGEVGDAPFARVGRFEEVEGPRDEGSGLLEMPEWDEEL